MRTKTLLLSAVLGVVGLSTTFAQVYSVNAVGYVNKTIPPGLSIIANPLNVVAGNKVSTVLNGAVDGMTIYRYSQAGGYSLNACVAPPAGGPPVWENPDEVINPGEAFWVLNPNTTPVTLTFVGDVVQGTAITTPLKAGLNLVASQVPQKALLSTVLGFPAVDGDNVYRFVGGAYAIYGFTAPPAGGPGAWDTEPEIDVAEGFWAAKVADVSWVRNFTVN